MAPDTDPWRPSGLVTLLSDFGEADAYVGMMKGVLASVGGRDVRAVDLTHAIAPQDVRAAAFHLAHEWRWFPPGTVHVCVCDPGVGTERAILVARAGGHAFVAPDTGLLGPALAAAPGNAWIGRLDVERVALPGRSRTFHGRDVFAPAAARIAAGAEPASLATRAPRFERIELPEGRRADSTALHGDRPRARGAVGCRNREGEARHRAAS
jgi:S-adenosylmethionine hydrolase